MPAPVLLVHGFASSFDRNWREPGWVDLLTDAGREVIAADLLGHGTAAKPHDPAAYVRLESNLAMLLPPEAVVDAIGFSLGARMLLGVAASRPHSFGRIVVGGVGESVLRHADPLRLHRRRTGISRGPPGLIRDGPIAPVNATWLVRITQVNPATRRLRWWKEVLAVVAFDAVYEWTSAKAAGARGVAGAHAQQIVDVERSAGIFREQAVQHWFLPHRFLIEASDLFYSTLHFVLPVVTLVWLFRRFPERYDRWR